MKKLIGIILSTAICFATVTAAAANADTELERLQADNARLQEELNASNELIAYLINTIEQMSNGDINGDGYTDAVDASIILGYYAYLSTDGSATLRGYLRRQ